MPTQILMPALSPTMEEGTLAKWLVKEGDRVAPGDIIAEIETDKATMEFEAADEGKLGKILVQEGTEGVKVNTPIAVLLADGEEAAEAAAPQTRAQAAQPRPEPDEARDKSAPAAESEAPPEREAQREKPAFEPSADLDLPEGVETVTVTMREALRDAMAEELRRDDKVFLMGEEVAEYEGAYKVTQGLLAEFGERRVVDTPITEHGFAGVGVGAAFAGLRPVVEFMTWNFAMQAMDQIINSAAKTNYMSGGQMRCPIVFRGPNGAAARVAAQHSQDFSAWYAHIPGLIVIAPSNPADAKGLLKSAIRDPNPVVFLEHEILYGQSGPVPKLDDWLVPIGKAKVVREGSDVTIVSFARGTVFALEAAAALQEEGLSAEVIDLRTLRPLDFETVLTSVKKTNRLVTVEESWPIASVGATLCARVTAEAFDYLDAPPMQVSGKDVPMPYAANLERLALPDAARVIQTAKAVCYVS